MKKLNPLFFALYSLTITTIFSFNVDAQNIKWECGTKGNHSWNDQEGANARCPMICQGVDMCWQTGDSWQTGTQLAAQKCGVDWPAPPHTPDFSICECQGGYGYCNPLPKSMQKRKEYSKKLTIHQFFSPCHPCAINACFV